jgi:hypothetical protein
MTWIDRQRPPITLDRRIERRCAQRVAGCSARQFGLDGKGV